MAPHVDSHVDPPVHATPQGSSHVLQRGTRPVPQRPPAPRTTHPQACPTCSPADAAFASPATVTTGFPMQRSNPHPDHSLDSTDTLPVHKPNHVLKRRMQRTPDAPAPPIQMCSTLPGEAAAGRYKGGSQVRKSSGVNGDRGAGSNKSPCSREPTRCLLAKHPTRRLMDRGAGGESSRGCGTRDEAGQVEVRNMGLPAVAC